jgi:hypothetical protein
MAKKEGWQKGEGPYSQFTGGTNARGSTDFLPRGRIMVEEGDLITFTPSGGGGVSIPGHFHATIW